jgi:hypothetical protein
MQIRVLNELLLCCAAWLRDPRGSAILVRQRRADNGADCVVIADCVVEGLDD